MVLIVVMPVVVAAESRLYLWTRSAKNVRKRENRVIYCYPGSVKAASKRRFT